METITYKMQFITGFYGRFYKIEGLGKFKSYIYDNIGYTIF